MRYAVIIRLDQTGSTAFIHREDSAPLEGEDGVRYRLVAETDDHGDAVRITDLMQGIETGASLVRPQHPESRSSRVSRRG